MGKKNKVFYNTNTYCHAVSFQLGTFRNELKR